MRLIGLAMKELDLFDPAKLKHLAVILLNSDRRLVDGDTLTDYLHFFWNKVAIRACTDGAANIIYEKRDSLKPPDLLCGDFDSISDESLHYFEKLGKTEVRRTPDQNSTDFTKCLRIVLNRIEADADSGVRFFLSTVAFEVLLHKGNTMYVLWCCFLGDDCFCFTHPCF